MHFSSSVNAIMGLVNSSRPQVLLHEIFKVFLLIYTSWNDILYFITLSHPVARNFGEYIMKHAIFQKRKQKNIMGYEIGEM